MFEKINTRFQRFLNNGKPPHPVSLTGLVSDQEYKSLCWPTHIPGFVGLPFSLAAELEVNVRRLAACSFGYETNVVRGMHGIVSFWATPRLDGWDYEQALSQYAARNTSLQGKHRINLGDPVTKMTEKAENEKERVLQNINDVLNHIETLEVPSYYRPAIRSFRRHLENFKKARERWNRDYEREYFQPFVPTKDGQTSS